MITLETYGVGWTYEDTQGLQMLILYVCLYLLRNTSSFFRTAWDIAKWILIAVLVIVTAGMILRWIKKL